MKRQTAASRKAVVNKVFGALDDADRDDVLAVDVNTIIERFVNLEGRNYTPESLQTYKSRLKSTLDDFSSYRQDPLSFRPSAHQRAARQSKAQSNSSSTAPDKPSIMTSLGADNTAARVIDTPVNILPIQIRADLTIKIQGLPFDMTVAEANKLAAVIKALAVQE